MSSFSLTSSPIRCSSPRQHGQDLLSTSTVVSMRGRCGWKRAAIGAPLARALRADRRRLRFGLGDGFRLGLFDVFEGEQQLIGRQRLGAATEAMALQVLDDLDKPLRTNPLGDQHRLQRVGIVGKRVDGLRHVRDDITKSAAFATVFLRPDSLSSQVSPAVAARQYL